MTIYFKKSNRLSIVKCLLLLAVFVLIACKKKEAPEEQVARQYVEDITKVKVLKARQGTFYKEILNNGKLSAIRKAEIHFEQPGEIRSVNVSNGQHVNREQLLAKIDDTNQKYELEKARLELDKALLAMEDYLIGAGYTLKDTATVPENIMNVALIKSAYKSAQSNYDRASQNYEETAIIAPFSGVVTNIEAKAYNQSSKYDILCDLIDNSAFEVDFSILETEFQQIKKGLPIELTIAAFSRDTFSGIISSINPCVDENGMITVKAEVPNKEQKLIEGMNARVIVKIAVPDQLIIPKSAVVLRQERKVVFTNHEDSTAYWNYVHVINENSTEVCISKENIKVGDEVISEGNLELGHLTPIRVH